LCHIYLFTVTSSYIDAAMTNKQSTVTENIIALCKQKVTAQSDKYPLSRESFYVN